jgi:hypothetical protein
MKQQNLLKRVAGIFCCVLMLTTAVAQPVPRKVVVEHFTNTLCSICASRNPGFYQNLAQFPDVLHLAIHPSAPYAACPLNQYNTPEQDARTNYYGVYGGTPRLAIQGTVIAASADYNSGSLFQSELGTFSSFAANIAIQPINATNGTATLTIIKNDTSTLDSLSLYAVLAIDTLQFAAGNGETIHYDVFRKSIWGAAPVKVALPLVLGDSVVYTQGFTIDAGWPSNRIYATAILQRIDNRVEQAARSSFLQQTTSTSSVTFSGKQLGYHVYPNPVSQRLTIEPSPTGTTEARVYDLQGRILISQSVSPNQKSIIVDALAPGVYILSVHDQKASQLLRFIKQ